MEARSLKFITNACAGQQLTGSPKTRVHRVCTDSRQAQPGDLFFALHGERFDGHDYLRAVASKEAAAVVIQRERSSVVSPGCAVVAVDNTRQALGRLAAEYRKEFTLPIVAVGGSNGKTTTKELLASVLKQKFATLWSEASFNNDIGVPLTLLKLEKTHQAAVMEVGSNHPGELPPLVAMIRPTHAIITNIGREHLEFFGDLAGVAQEEGFLAELLPSDGKLFINGDNEWTTALIARTRAQVERVGFSDSNDWRVRSLQVNNQGVSFRVETKQTEFTGEYHMNLVGRHQVINAVLAIAAGVELGLNRDEINSGLKECKPAKMRLQLWEFNGVRVLDDAYNANADSVLAALQTLMDLPCKGRRVALLGDMAELGEHSEAAHEEIGRRAAELGVAQLFTVGKMASVVARGARGAGLNRVLEFADVETAASAVKSFLKPGDLLLLKASRAARLERVGELLRKEESAN
jgi:UDP-N-acetylmuramoyl-tripeptide--D-alanyl-D-alanine ligase